MIRCDVIISGAGPAGSSCAAFCAKAGLKVLVLEREEFPRDKVCGDCINPSAWPVLERMGAAKLVMGLPHTRTTHVEIAAIDGESYTFEMEASERGEITVKRSLLDHALATHAEKQGAMIFFNQTVTGVEKADDGYWIIHCGKVRFSAQYLIAADGRNSTLARLLGRLPPVERDRVALQTHTRAPLAFGNKVLLQLLPEGYCGAANTGTGELNLCLVGTGKSIGELQEWATKRFLIPKTADWNTVTPISRRHISPIAEHGRAGLICIGDAARVVEPFTGEGIYYALASGELAALYVAGSLSDKQFLVRYDALYEGRLWINRLTKFAVLNPNLGSAVLKLAKGSPFLLSALTAKVVGPGKTMQE
jgi:geranylgeranyl reductase family protein